MYDDFVYLVVSKNDAISVIFFWLININYLQYSLPLGEMSKGQRGQKQKKQII